MKTPHKHAEIIKAWADGAEIEYRVNDGKLGWSGWKPFDNLERFLSDPWWDYRIKPEPKPDLKLFYFVSDYAVQCSSQIHIHNLALTFDGATGALKSAEVV